MATKTLRIDKDLHSAIQRIARTEGRFMREIVRRSVGLYAGLSPTERVALDFNDSLTKFEQAIKGVSFSDPETLGK